MPPVSKCAGTAGFTLLEVIVAIMILASALVIILGMQSAVIDQSVRAQQEQQAMLLARRILARLETGHTSVPDGTSEFTGNEILEKFELESRESEERLERIEGLAVRTVVDYSGVPGVDLKAMRRILLTIAWGPTADDQFEAVFFVANDEEPEPVL